MNTKLLITGLFLVCLIAGVGNAVEFNLLDSDFSKIDGSNLYYSQTPKLDIRFSDVIHNLTIYVNNNEEYTTNADGNYMLEFPEGETYNLKVTHNSTIIYNKTLTPIQLKVLSLSTILISNTLQTQEQIKYKIITNNDDLAKSEIVLITKVYDPEGNEIEEETEFFSISASSNIAKTFSFTPTEAGEHKIKTEVYYKNFLLETSEKTLDIQITKPDITLNLPRTEVSVPSDIVATATIHNTKTARDYDLLLKIYNPAGDIIDEQIKEVSVLAEAIRTQMFQLSLDEDSQAGEYILLLKTTFNEGGETYEQEEQRTLTIITPSANVLPTLKLPEKVEVSKDFNFILSFNHLSSKQFTYSYQCFFYDDNNFLSYTYPQTRGRITLGNQEQKDLKLNFRVPSDFKTGKYKVECKTIYGNDIFLATGETQITQPDNYLNLRATSDYDNGQGIITIGYSTKSIKELLGFVNIFILDKEDKLLDSDLNNEVTINGKLTEFKTSFFLPQDIPPQDIKVLVELVSLDTTLTETMPLIHSKDSLELYCSSDFVTPQNSAISCSVAGINSQKGKVYIGIAKEDTIIPRIFRNSNKAILLNVQERELTQTIYNNQTNQSETIQSELSFNLDFSNIKDQNAKIVAVFVDENDVTTSQSHLVTVIPKGASITKTKTFSQNYYAGDRSKPLSQSNQEFQQDITIKSNSNSIIKIKVVPIASSEELMMTGESRTLELAPNSAKTLSFIHKQTRNEPLDVIKVSYDVYLIDEVGKEYLIETKEIEGVAPATYYKSQEPTTQLNAKPIIIIIVGLIIIIFFIWLVMFLGRRKNRMSEIDVDSKSEKEHYE